MPLFLLGAPLFFNAFFEKCLTRWTAEQPISGVIASMMFMAMLHSAPWRPNYEEAEQAERQDKMNELRQRDRQH